MIKFFFKWFAGFFEDQSGTASRKAAAGYWGLLMLTYMIYKSVNGREVSMEIFMMVISFTGGMFGLMLLERFAKQTLLTIPTHSAPPIPTHSAPPIPTHSAPPC